MLHDRRFSSSIRLAALLALLAAGPFLQGQSDEPAWEFGGDLTERAAENARALALRESESLRIDPGHLAEITADLERIYAFDDGLAAAPARLPFAPGQVLVRVTPEVDAQLETGDFAPWAGLQEELGQGTARRILRSRNGSDPLWLFAFDEPLNSRLLAQRMEAEWEGALSARPDFLMGDGPDVKRSAELDWYAFILRWGDCPSGCTGEKRRLVAIEDGEVREIDAAIARGLLEVREVDYPQAIAASIGDLLRLRGEATIGPAADPSVTVESELRWAVEGEDGWRLRHQSHYIGDGSVDAGLRVAVVHPLSTAFWTFPVEIRLLERPALSGDRYADYWVHHAVGWVNDLHYPWLWSLDHQWWALHEEASDEAGWWAYDLQLGWLYTAIGKEDGYPFLFLDGRWLYYLPGSAQPRNFWDYRTEAWMKVE